MGSFATDESGTADGFSVVVIGAGEPVPWVRALAVRESYEKAAITVYSTCHYIYNSPSIILVVMWIPLNR